MANKCDSQQAFGPIAMNNLVNISYSEVLITDRQQWILVNPESLFEKYMKLEENFGLKRPYG